jgi:hypothetical protein
MAPRHMALETIMFVARRRREGRWMGDARARAATRSRESADVREKIVSVHNKLLLKPLVSGALIPLPILVISDVFLGPPKQPHFRSVYQSCHRYLPKWGTEGGGWTLLGALYSYRDGGPKRGVIALRCARRAHLMEH